MIALPFPPISIDGVGSLREARHDGVCAVVPPMHGKEKKKSVGGSNEEERKLGMVMSRSRKINGAHRPVRRSINYESFTSTC